MSLKCQFDCGTDSVGLVNEDAVAFNQHSGWILDGATSLSGRKQEIAGQLFSDASWLAHRFSQLLSAGSSADLLAAAQQALMHIRDEAPALWGDWSGSDVPSACLSHVMVHDGVAQLSNLGDCTLLYRVDGGEVQSFGSSAVDLLDQALREQYIQLRQVGKLGHQAAWEQLVPTIRAYRARMNTEDGYWILSPDGLGLAHMQQCSLSFSHSFEAVLVTDGLYRLVDTYFAYSSAAFFDQLLLPANIDGLIKALRAIESADSSATRYPRLKLQDDATALVIQAHR